MRALFGVVSRTIAHCCHDERVHVVQIDAEWRTVPPANIVIDACRPSLVHKREAGRTSIGDRGARVQCVARPKWSSPLEFTPDIFIDEF